MINNTMCPTPRKISRGLTVLAALGVFLGVGAGKALGVTDAPEQTKPAQTPTPTPQNRPPAKVAPTPKTQAPVPTPKSAARAMPSKRAATRPKTSGPPVPGLWEKAAYTNQRDPFKSLVYASMSNNPQPGSELTGPLPPGMRGLVIGPLVLEGIVRQDTTNTMIAVVANETKRAYFLRENDALYNGIVSKITPDAVYFQENFVDPSSGRVSTREVVKRMTPAPGELK